MVDLSEGARLLEADEAHKVIDAYAEHLKDNPRWTKLLDDTIQSLHVELHSSFEDWFVQNVAHNLKSTLDAARRQAQSDRTALTAARAENERLREALEKISKLYDPTSDDGFEATQMADIARATLAASAPDATNGGK